jgi:hypothetical protein
MRIHSDPNTDTDNKSHSIKNTGASVQLQFPQNAIATAHTSQPTSSKTNLRTIRNRGPTLGYFPFTEKYRK